MELVPDESASPDSDGRAARARLDPRLERRLQRAMDLGERAFTLVLFAYLVAGMVRALPARPWDGLLLVSSGLMAFFIMFRRRAQAVSTRPFDWLVALMGTTAPMLLRAGGHPLAPPSVGAPLMAAGILIGIWAKLSLRRSFGLAAANRGVVAAGPYAFVRHPMYAGYLMVDTGFVLTNPSAWNLAVWLADVGLQVVRVVVEEKVLARDPDYGAFKDRVRFRLAPGLF